MNNNSKVNFTTKEKTTTTTTETANTVTCNGRRNLSEVVGKEVEVLEQGEVVKDPGLEAAQAVVLQVERVQGENTLRRK